MKSVSKPQMQRSSKQTKTASFDEKSVFHLLFGTPVYENNSKLECTEQNCTFFMQLSNNK